jgi:hypothetical protein
MADQAELDNSFLDNADLTGIDVSRPLLPKQVLTVRTGDVRIEKSDDGSKRYLVVPLVLEETGKDTKGNPVNVGFSVTDRLLLTPTGGLTQQMINEKLARFQTAVLATDKPGPFGQLDQYQGKLVRVQFDVRADKQDPDNQFQDVRRYMATK